MRSASKSHLDLVVDSSPYESPAEIVDFIAVHVGPKRLFRESVEHLCNPGRIRSRQLLPRRCRKGQRNSFALRLFFIHRLNQMTPSFEEHQYDE